MDLRLEGLLAGLCVVDLTRGIAGPVAGMLLADNGADVIRVEPPGGDPYRAVLPAYHAWNRGKRSVVLDLKSDAGRESLLGLLATSDMMLESFRPGTLERMGLAPDELRRRFPQLVVTSISGYGLDHPRRNEPAYEGLVDAWLGLQEEQQGARPGPHYNALPVASYGAAFLAVTGALAALRARRTTGRAQRVDTSLADGAVLLNTMNWYWSERCCDKGKTTPPTGRLFMRNLLQLGVLRCGDGKYIQLHTGPVGKWQEAMALLGLADRLPRLAPGEERSPLARDEAGLVEREVPRIIAAKPRAHWLELCARADVAALPVDDAGVIYSDPQVVLEGTVVNLDDLDLGRIKVVGPVLKCPQAPPKVGRPAPRVGQHDAEVAAKLAKRPAHAAAAASSTTSKSLQHPLQGIRILDFGAFFAGPYGARILADLGADVIKVETPAGDAMRGSDGPFRAAQRGKRDLAVDLKSKEGQAIVHELVATADIVTHNMRPGAAERLGLEYARLAAIKPDLVYLYAPGFGSTGPSAQLQAFAPMLSGMAGVMSQAAGPGNKPCYTVTNEDFVNGCLGAVWMLMGLAHRDRSGRGVYLEGSLLNSTLLMACEAIVDAAGRPLFRFDVGSEQLGFGPLCRLYRSADGWLCLVSGTAREWRALTQVRGLEALAGDVRFGDAAARRAHASALASMLEQWFAARSTDEAFAALRSAGVPCEIPRASGNIGYFLDDDNLRLGRVVEYTHAKYGRARDMGHAIRFSETPGIIRGPSPLLGEHTDEILREQGYDEARIADLRARGILNKEVRA
jgi:crotonobetainyl-CoA:carnitine CoA-transferase CaiB-like acyl-CoA transferase